MPASHTISSTSVVQYDKAKILGGRTQTVHEELDTVTYELRKLSCVGLRISAYVPYPTLSQQNGCEAESFAPLYFPAILVQPPCAIATSCSSAISTSHRAPHLTSPHLTDPSPSPLPSQYTTHTDSASSDSAGCLLILAPEIAGFPCRSHASAFQPPRAGTLVDVDRG